MTAKKAPAKTGKTQNKPATAKTATKPRPSKPVAKKPVAAKKPSAVKKPEPAKKTQAKPKKVAAPVRSITKPVVGSGKGFKAPVKQQPRTKAIKPMPVKKADSKKAQVKIVSAKKPTAAKTDAKKTDVKKTAVKKTAAAKPAAVKKAAVSQKPSAAKKPAIATKPAAPVKIVSPKSEKTVMTKPEKIVPPKKKPAPAKTQATKSAKNAKSAQQSVASKTPYFSQEEIKWFRDALLSLHKQLVSRVRQQLGDALPVVDKINIEEDGTEAFDRVVGLEQAGMDQAKINKVIEALRALDNGTYGLCQLCGCTIASVRLKALPFAFTCVDCQNKIDNPGGEKTRLVDLLDE